MITLNKAKQLALDGIEHVTGRVSSQLRILDELTECKRTGWFFRYESRAYVEGRDGARPFGDTGPVVVTHRGTVHVLRGGRPIDEALDEFERYRAECTTHA